MRDIKDHTIKKVNLEHLGSFPSKSSPNQKTRSCEWRGSCECFCLCCILSKASPIFSSGYTVAITPCVFVIHCLSLNWKSCEWILSVSKATTSLPGQCGHELLLTNTNTKRTASTFHVNMKILCVVNIGCCMPFSLKEFILNGVKGERNYITLVRKTQTMVYARTSDLPELDERVSECVLFALLRRGFSACSGV